MPVLVGDAAEFRNAANRVRSASGMAEKALISFVVSSMLRVISVSSPVSCPLTSCLPCIIVLIPSSMLARCIVLSLSSPSSLLEDSIVCVDAPSGWPEDSDGDGADLLPPSSDCFLRGERNLSGLDLPLLRIGLAALIGGEPGPLKCVSWHSSSSEVV